MRIPFLRRMNKNTELKFEKSSEKWKKKKRKKEEVQFPLRFTSVFNNKVF